MQTAIYARISSDRAGEAVGVARQESDCRELCAAQGLDVADILIDNDVSASQKKRRPQFDRLIDGIRAGTYEAVAVYNIDRLYRSPIELEGLIELVEAGKLPGGIQAVTSAAFDLNTSNGRTMARVLVSVAKGEAERTSERLKAFHKARAKEGKAHTGRRAFGFLAADKKTGRPHNTVHDAAEANLIREAAARVIAGESLRGISTDWAERGILSPGKPRNGTPQPFNTSTLRKILAAPRIAGLRQHKDKLYPGAWDPILDQGTWDKVRTIVLDPGRSPGRAKRGYWLRPVIHCGVCGHSLISGSGGKKGHPRYYCPTPRDGGCGGISATARGTEQLIEDGILYRLTQPRTIEALDTAVNNEAAADITAKIGDLEERKATAAEMFAAGTIDADDYATIRGRIADELDQLHKQRIGAERAAVLAEVGVDVAAWWGSTDTNTRRRVVRALVDRIDITKATKVGRVFDPNRVVVAWRA